MYLILLSAFLILAAICILFIPFHISLKLDADGLMLKRSLCVRWLGLQLCKTDRPSKEEPAKGAFAKKRKDKEGAAKRPWSNRSGIPNWGIPMDASLLIDALQSMISLCRYLMSHIRVSRLQCKISYGLEDPSETAAISGLIWAATSTVYPAANCVRIDPYFGGERFNGSLDLEIEARIFWALAAIIRGVQEGPIRRMLKVTLQERISKESWMNRHLKNPRERTGWNESAH